MITINDIHRKVAFKLGIKESIVEEVNRCQYEFTISTMKDAEHSISLKRIGKLIRKPNGIKKYWRRISEPIKE